MNIAARRLRSADDVHTLIAYLYGYEKITRKIVRSWNLQQRRQAQDYFLAIHFQMNDANVQVPKMPRFIKQVIK